jgi:tRNA pseudouridine55 synthase
MDGILIIDKPAGITSHDAVARARRILKTKRIGHTGTLDPFATGVLVLLVGSATRLAQFVDKDEKEYEAVMQFGSETDTGDVEGLRTADCGLRISEVEAVLENLDWEGMLDKFRGEVMQTPPMYSAKKVDGKKLYEYARAGREIARDPVKVSISKLELLPLENSPPYEGGVSAASADGVVLSNEIESTIRIHVVCSAGTYVRQLAKDIGRAVGPGAHLVELRRTRAGRFRLDDALTLEQLEKMESPTDALKKPAEIVAHLPQIELTAERADRTRNGLSTRVEMDAVADGAAVRMLDQNSSLIALGIYDGEQKMVKPKIVLV